ncbi:hypothetical protein Tco_0549105 [Tanacetum coccineum]
MIDHYVAFLSFRHCRVTDDELMTKKLIKFRLGGRGHTLTLLEFARRLGLYHSAEISDGGFEVYFQGGVLLLSYAIQIGIAEMWAWLIDIVALKGWEARAFRREHECLRVVITRMAKRMNLLTDEVLDRLSATTYCRALDATPLESPHARVISDLFDWMGCWRFVRIKLESHSSNTIAGVYMHPPMMEEAAARRIKGVVVGRDVISWGDW